MASLARAAFELGVKVHVKTPAIELIQAPISSITPSSPSSTSSPSSLSTPQQTSPRVIGAWVLHEGRRIKVHAAQGVVLACGGFPHDPKRKSKLLERDPHGTAHFSAAAWGNTGDGLNMGEGAGGRVETQLKNAAAMAPVSLVPNKEGGFTHFPHLLERGKPGLIAVTRFGKRFTNEANSYYDFMEGLMNALPADEEVQAWLVVDQDFISRWGLGAVKPFPVPKRAMLANGYLKRAKTLSELALACGIEVTTLIETVERYNAMAHVGYDGDFQKGQTPYNRMQGDAQHPGKNPCMGPLKNGPFYAVRVVAGSLGTFAGLRCNENAQVLDQEDSPIPGLYAGGNDLSSIMAGHYPSGGITLGPAMTFGFIAGAHAAGLNPDSIFSKGHTMYYELATMTLPFGTAAQAAQNIQTFCAQGGGELLACWFTDIGTLNQMIVFRSFPNLESLQKEKARTQHNASPFGCGEIFLKLEQHSYQGFPWMKPARSSAQSGIQGPVYEIRTYGIKPGGVQPTLDLWEQAMPEREKISPCVVAMVALDGPLRFTNIWAYPSLDARSKARADAVAKGIWPPKGGPAHLTTDMSSTIAMPTAVSPLR